MELNVDTNSYKFLYNMYVIRYVYIDLGIYILVYLLWPYNIFGRMLLARNRNAYARHIHNS